MSNSITHWAIATLLALGLSAVAGPSAEPDVLPMAVPSAACPPGLVGVWIDSTMAECQRGLPESLVPSLRLIRHLPEGCRPHDRHTHLIPARPCIGLFLCRSRMKFQPINRSQVVAPSERVHALKAAGPMTVTGLAEYLGWKSEKVTTTVGTTRWLLPEQVFCTVR